MQRHLRLRHKNDFARLRTHGQIVNHQYLRLSYLPNDLPHNRYGFIVSRRIGKATQRNRVRRLLREVMRHRDPIIVGYYDMVLVARDRIVQATYHELGDVVDDLLHRAKIIP